MNGSLLARRRVIVTRPQPQADAWVSALREAGCQAEAWPLLEIVPPQSAQDIEGLRHWQSHWPACDALMFVSGAAVSHFWAGATVPTAGGKPRFWAPGPGTAQALAEALRDRGLDPGRIDSPSEALGRFDSEALWSVVRPQVIPGTRVLCVRGRSVGTSEVADDEPRGHGRDWLAARCGEVGARWTWCVAYERRAPVGPEAVAWRRALEDGSLWLLSSAEALGHLVARGMDLDRAQALATHPRIAEAARAAGFGHVCVTAPTVAAVRQACLAWDDAWAWASCGLRSVQGS